MPAAPQHPRRNISFNMTPMIDVVFLLIIFFLVSSHLAKQETQMEMDLPAADSGNQAVESKDRLVVNVLENGSISIKGRTVPSGQLQQRFAQHLQKAGPNLEVRIRSDRTTSFKFVEPVLLNCARAGIWNVTFAVYRTRDAK